MNGGKRSVESCSRANSVETPNSPIGLLSSEQDLLTAARLLVYFEALGGRLDMGSGVGASMAGCGRR